MAITTFDGLLAGLNAQAGIGPRFFMKHMISTELPDAAGILHNLAYTPGVPGMSTVPTVGIAGEGLTSRSGSLPWINPVSGNTYLAQFAQTASVANQSLILIDRIWHCTKNASTGTTTTTEVSTGAASINIARDVNGSTAGLGLQMAFEVFANLSNAGDITSSIWVRYTNNAGSTGKIASCSKLPAVLAKGSFIPIPLAAGDLGINRIDAIMVGTSLVAGVLGLVVYRQIAVIDAPAIGGVGRADAVSLGLPRLYDNTVPELILSPIGTSQAMICGLISYAQG